MSLSFHRWFLPESPRWLTSQNRSQQASQIVDRIAKFNNWSQEKLSYLLAEESDKEVPGPQQRQANFTDLFRTPVIRKRILIMSILG